MIKRPRQFKVIHVTGQVTLVNDVQYQGGTGRWRAADERVARQAGHCHPADCSVHVVPVGQETPLPFDQIPLIVRRASA